MQPQLGTVLQCPALLRFLLKDVRTIRELKGTDVEMCKIGYMLIKTDLGLSLFLCVCVCVGYGAGDLPYMGPSHQFSFNFPELCQNCAGKTQQNQGNATSSS